MKNLKKHHEVTDLFRLKSQKKLDISKYKEDICQNL